MNFFNNIFGRKVEKKLGLMLLGPGSRSHLADRRRTATKLEELCYDPIIMEDYCTNPAAKGGIDNLFIEICDHKNPYLFVAFMHRGADLRGVEDEISFLRV